MRLLLLATALSILAAWWFGYIGVFAVVAGLNVLFGLGGMLWFRHTLGDLRRRAGG